jgi:hypothetical protein
VQVAPATPLPPPHARRRQAKQRVLDTAAALERAAPFRPDAPGAAASLLGEWGLVFASDGTVVTRAAPAQLLAQLAGALPGFGLSDIQQRLETPAPGALEGRCAAGGRLLGRPGPTLEGQGGKARQQAGQPHSRLGWGAHCCRGCCAAPAPASRAHQLPQPTPDVGPLLRAHAPAPPPGDRPEAQAGAGVSCSNAVSIGLGPFGTWQVRVKGHWLTCHQPGWRFSGAAARRGGGGGGRGGADEEPGLASEVAFDGLGVRLQGVLGVDLGQVLPEFMLSVPRRAPRAQANWRTTYCDGEYRIGRGVETGGVFLFKKKPA